MMRPSFGRRCEAAGAPQAKTLGDVVKPLTKEQIEALLGDPEVKERGKSPDALPKGWDRLPGRVLKTPHPSDFFITGISSLRQMAQRPAPSRG